MAITQCALTCGALALRSVTSASVNPFTANFAAQYAVCGRCMPMSVTVCASTAVRRAAARGAGEQESRRQESRRGGVKAQGD